jgi:hypothetical protein
MSEEDRRAIIVSEYNIIPRGVSVFFERQKKINNYVGFYKVMNSIPEVAQMMIEWRSVMKDIIDLFALDNAEDKIKTEEQISQEQQAAEMQRQQMLQMEMQKIMAPMQTKLQQTEMGIRERMATTASKMQAEMEKAVLEMQAKLQAKLWELENNEKDRRHKMGVDVLKQAMSSI